VLAVLLAAGRGRRVGGPKALLDLLGMTALERCVRALRDGGADELRVVLGHGAAQARAALPADLAARVDFILNPDPDRGQTSSIRAGLAPGPGAGSCFALHTVDHPLLRAEDLIALREAFHRREAPVPRGQGAVADDAAGDGGAADAETGIRIVVPVVGGRRGHPALFASCLAAEFLALGDGQPGHAVLRADPCRVLELASDNAWLVRDIDTPADLAAARAALGA